MSKHAHDHTLHHGPSLAEAARMTLLKSGEQWTEMRASIFDALAGFDKPASAYDIAEAVSKARGQAGRSEQRLSHP
jgi:Fur family zinc uptake transcriptional regulator